MRRKVKTMKCMMIALVLGLMPGIASQAAAKPLKVFILAGQSNMQGHVNVSTFDSMADDPKTASILKEMRNADGTPRVCEKVWISSVGCAGDGWSDVIEQTGKLTTGFGASPEEIGPEFTFGIYLEKLLGEPILLIKTSWGGRSLHTDFRPPGAGPYGWSDYELTQCKRRGDDLEKDKAEKVKATAVFYRHMIEHVRKVLADIRRVVPEYDPKQGYELAGLVWFQGRDGSGGQEGSEPHSGGERRRAPEGHRGDLQPGGVEAPEGHLQRELPLSRRRQDFGDAWSLAKPSARACRKCSRQDVEAR